MVKGLHGTPTLRWPDRLFALGPLRFVVWVMVSVVSHAGILSDPFKLAEWMDDHQFFAWEQSDRMTVLRWHQLPEWNPYWCGGTVGVAAPEDPFFGPDFLLRLVYGVSHGRRLAIMLLVVLGFEGMYRLCRRLDSSAIGAVFAAVVYGTCDRFVSFIHDGWVNFMGFELIPMVLYFLVEGAYGPAQAVDPERHAAHVRRARIFGGFFVAWIVLAAGTYPTPYAMLAVAYVTLALVVYGFFRAPPSPVPARADRPTWAKLVEAPWALPLVSGAVIGLVAFGLTAGKLLPMMSFLRQFPRVFTPVEAHQATELFGGIWARYSLVLLLALLAVVTADVVAGIFLGGALFFFALAMGDFGGASPHHLIRALPIVGQLRFPDRYMVMVLMFAAVAAARGITRVEDAFPAAMKLLWERLGAFRNKPQPYPRELGWLFVGLATFIAYSKVVLPAAEEIVAGVRIKPGAMYVQEPPREYDGPFRQARGNRRDAHMFTTANLGSNYCAAGNPVAVSALLRGDSPQEEYPLDPEKATVRRLSWSPNEIKLEVDAKEATTVLVNQNWAKQWTTNVGSVRSHELLLAVDVPAGKREVVIAYKDRFLEICLLLSIATLGFVLWLVGKDLIAFVKAQRARWEAMPVWPDDESPEAASTKTESSS